MKNRVFSLALALLMASLVPTFTGITQAQDGPPPSRGNVGGFGALPNDRPPGPPGEGGPRGDGPGGGGPAETPEQRNARTLATYVDIIPDLTESQKTHIMVILNVIGMEATAIGQDDTLSQERKVVVGRALRTSVGERIKSALTDAQLTTYVQFMNDRVNAQAEMQKVIDNQVGEDLQVSREQAIKGYEDFLDELSVKQKTQIIKILELAQGQMMTVNADTTLTADQKKLTSSKVHDDVSAKVLPLLDADQTVDWKKAHDAKKPQ